MGKRIIKNFLEIKLIYMKKCSHKNDIIFNNFVS